MLFFQTKLHDFAVVCDLCMYIDILHTLSIYIYICLYMYIYIDIYVYMYIHVHIFIYVYEYVHIYIYTLHMYVYMCRVYIYIHAYLNTCIVNIPISEHVSSSFKCLHKGFPRSKNNGSIVCSQSGLRVSPRWVW